MSAYVKYIEITFGKISQAGPLSGFELRYKAVPLKSVLVRI